MWNCGEVVGVADERLIGPWATVLAQVEGQLGARRAHLRPLAVEYVSALREAAEAVAAARENPFVELKSSGRIVEHPGFASADREARRALSYAQVLELTDPGNLPTDHPLYSQENEPLDALDQLDAETQFDADPVEDARIHFERRERQRVALKGRK
jgi:hypothetical protein